MEERLLLNRIALHACRVSPRDVEFAAAIKANLAYPGLAIGDRATVSAGKATNTIVTEILDQR